MALSKPFRLVKESRGSLWAVISIYFWERDHGNPNVLWIDHEPIWAFWKGFWVIREYTIE